MQQHEGFRRAEEDFAPIGKIWLWLADAALSPNIARIGRLHSLIQSNQSGAALALTRSQHIS